MTLASAEHIATTQLFIDANPTTITLSRTTRASDGSGGWVPGATTPAGQITGRLVSVSKPGQTLSRVNANGEVVVPDFAFVCLPSADIRIRDQFTIGSHVYEVLFVSQNPEWRKSAEVFRHGG